MGHGQQPLQARAGKLPPLLVGRDRLVRDWVLRLNEVGATGRAAAEDVLLTGPRGVGKTCAVTVLGDRARERGYEVINLQAVRDERTLVTSLIRQADAAVAGGRGPWTRAKQALERFAGLHLGVGGLRRVPSLTVPPSTRLKDDGTAWSKSCLPAPTTTEKERPGNRIAAALP